MYDEKRAKTIFCGKTFLLKCLCGDKLREYPPKAASDIHHQLLRVSINTLNLSSTRIKMPIGQMRIYASYDRSLNKLITDITDILYLSTLWKND